MSTTRQRKATTSNDTSPNGRLQEGELWVLYECGNLALYARSDDNGRLHTSICTLSHFSFSDTLNAEINRLFQGEELISIAHYFVEHPEKEERVAAFLSQSAP